MKETGALSKDPGETMMIVSSTVSHVYPRDSAALWKITVEPGTVNWRLDDWCHCLVFFLSTLFFLFLCWLLLYLNLNVGVPQPWVLDLPILCLHCLPRHWHYLHENDSLMYISSPGLLRDWTSVPTSLLNTSTRIPHRHLILNMSKQNSSFLRLYKPPPPTDFPFPLGLFNMLIQQIFIKYLL